jgi:hypothetical protein
MADPALDVAVELVRDRASLAWISAQWEELARQALESSPFLDPAMTLALLEAPGAGGFRCCLSWARDPERSDLPAALGGLFALRRERSACGFPSWVVYTVLVRAAGAQRHVAALLDWLRRNGATVVEFRQVPREGRLNEALADVLRERDAMVYTRDVAAPGGVGDAGLRNLLIALGAAGAMRLAVLALLDRAKRRMGVRSRTDAPPVAA